MARNKLSTNYETASADVQDAVASLRRQGIKTVAAFYELARAIGVTQTRVRNLFFREGTPRIQDDERRAIRAAVILHHRRLAARHRELAIIEETTANMKETEELLNQLKTEDTGNVYQLGQRKANRNAA